MTFIVKRDGAVLMHTENPKCIPNEETILAMMKSGYKITLNGKTYKKGMLANEQV